MFEQAFKNIANLLWNDARRTSQLHYTERTSCLLVLKYLDALGQPKPPKPPLTPYPRLTLGAHFPFAFEPTY